MTDSSSDRNPVEALAEEFLGRKRRGEPATPEEYAEQYPELADEIRDRFPAMAEIERADGARLRPGRRCARWATTAFCARWAAAAWASSTRRCSCRWAGGWR